MRDFDQSFEYERFCEILSNISGKNVEFDMSKENVEEKFFFLEKGRRTILKAAFWHFRVTFPPRFEGRRVGRVGGLLFRTHCQQRARASRGQKLRQLANVHERQLEGDDHLLHEREVAQFRRDHVGREFQEAILRRGVAVVGT